MFDFIADHPVLDFVATVSERRTRYADKLAGPTELDAWVRESGLRPGLSPVDAAGFARAVEVREAAFTLISAVIDGEPLAPDALAVVNEAAARPTPSVALGPDLAVERSGDLDAVLAALARDCVELLGGPDRALLHWCADATCTRSYVDRSRGARRRWCGMRGCGDRAKAAAYRRRRAVTG
ncbi:CGNR zinc finger domain-containing protein [Pseudonocardia sp. CA-107938]|uniref:CGNR zinc finger domain-containing protein n=1 Tax=Pseudonocardia sp. CA-107938 TaxID=3240021 RepID=UPI003D8F9178